LATFCPPFGCQIFGMINFGREPSMPLKTYTCITPNTTNMKATNQTKTYKNNFKKIRNLFSLTKLTTILINIAFFKY
jgi:hypothetical protein